MDLLEEPDDKIIKLALTYWANAIETGDLHVSASDLRRMGGITRTLMPEQIQLVNRLRRMAEVICG